MALIILTERNPLESVRMFLARCAYVLIPLSVLVIKYYPEVSRRYNEWTYEAFFVGITTNKNSMGITLSVCGISLWWMLLGLRDRGRVAWKKWAAARYILLLIMTAWLLAKARSSTAVTCTILGGCLLLAMRLSFIRNRLERLELYSACLVVGVIFCQACGLWDAIVAEFAEMLGRDPSLHGRTAIWETLLKQDINPLLGVGYYSFWSPERMTKLSEGGNITIY